MKLVSTELSHHVKHLPLTSLKTSQVLRSNIYNSERKISKVIKVDKVDLNQEIKLKVPHKMALNKVVNKADNKVLLLHHKDQEIKQEVKAVKAAKVDKVVKLLLPDQCKTRHLHRFLKDKLLTLPQLLAQLVSVEDITPTKMDKLLGVQVIKDRCREIKSTLQMLIALLDKCTFQSPLLIRAKLPFYFN